MLVKMSKEHERYEIVVEWRGREIVDSRLAGLGEAIGRAEELESRWRARRKRPMRNASPSSRWLDRWAAAHRKAGGWDGPATLRALTPLASDIYRAGGTPAAAGLATARDYRLSGRIAELEERP